MHRLYPHKIVMHHELRQLYRPLVFTNGVFDILHAGHVWCLQRAKQLGMTLLVAVNGDDSARRLGKGPDRPINSLGNRVLMLDALECVDLVTYFDEDTPQTLIEHVQPDILVKGGDYDPATIAGADFVRSRGGQVVTIPQKINLSTTKLVERIRASAP